MPRSTLLLPFASAPGLWPQNAPKIPEHDRSCFMDASQRRREDAVLNAVGHEPHWAQSSVIAATRCRVLSWTRLANEVVYHVKLPSGAVASEVERRRQSLFASGISRSSSIPGPSHLDEGFMNPCTKNRGNVNLQVNLVVVRPEDTSHTP